MRTPPNAHSLSLGILSFSLVILLGVVAGLLRLLRQARREAEENADMAVDAAQALFATTEPGCVGDRSDRAMLRVNYDELVPRCPLCDERMVPVDGEPWFYVCLVDGHVSEIEAPQVHVPRLN